MPRVLAGRYEIGDLIGRGGMAEVRIGYDSRLGRTVAIKLLRTDLGEDPTFHARFRREAQSSAALNHPAIVAVYDTGEEPFTDANGNPATLPYIVMEYVEGHTVRELLQDGAAVPIDEAIEITVGILSALEYAHHEGIVHRDIKPGNIMLTPKGQVKVMDFGIARAMSDQQATMTQTNSVVGTAQYLSPEQARGEAVDQRSDLYSTGVLLFELLTGRPPFQGDSALSVAYQHVREVPPVPSSIASDVPEPLDRVVMKALAKDVDERYQDANQFRSDLLAVMRGGAINAPAATAYLPVGAAAGPATAVMGTPAPVSRTPESTGPTTGALPVTRPIDDDGDKKNRWWIWLLVLLGIGAISLGAMALLNGGEPEPQLVAVPGVVGEDQETAAQLIEDAQLTFVYAGTENSDDITAGLATRSEPGAATMVEPGSTVRVWFSAGVETVKVPDLTGMTIQQATDVLKARGLELGTQTEQNVAGAQKDEITESNPAADTEVPKGSTVDVTVATGNVDLVDLTGKLQADAETLLENSMKLQYTVVEEESDTVQAGLVTRTDPAAGEVPTNQLVTLYVSSGAPNQPPVIQNATQDLVIQVGADFDLMEGVTATDPEDGDVTERVTVSNVDNSQPGEFFVEYNVTDSEGLAGEPVSRRVIVEPVPEQTPSETPTPTPTPTPTAPGNSGGNPGNGGPTP